MAAALVSLPQSTVATAGTKVPLVTTAVSSALKLYITTPSTNTGNIFIGDGGVSSTEGIIIAKGTTFVMETPSELLALDAMFVDAATSGDKFQVSYLSKI